MQSVDRASWGRLFYLRKNIRGGHRSSFRMLLEVAPWVNVALLLLLFFMVNASFVVQPGVVIDLPAAPMSGGASYGSMVVTLSQEGMVFFNDERTTLDGLAESLTQAARKDHSAALVVEADSHVPHGTLVQVYNMAYAAGVKDVVLATRIAEPRSTP